MESYDESCLFDEETAKIARGYIRCAAKQPKVSGRYSTILRIGVVVDLDWSSKYQMWNVCDFFSKEAAEKLNQNAQVFSWKPEQKGR